MSRIGLYLRRNVPKLSTQRFTEKVEEEWAKLRAEMGEEWYRRHRYREGD